MNYSVHRGIPKESMVNYTFYNANIYDGSGKPPYLGTVSINGARIVDVHNTPGLKFEAEHQIDAHGMALCPSFIDTHTHSDMILLHEGKQHSSITQGVSTEIIGQDGLGYAPLSSVNLASYSLYLKGLNGYFEDVPLDFYTTSDYLSRYIGRIGVNIAWLLPHCALRLETAGYSRRLLTKIELDKACGIARDAIQSGAKGFSTGLSYYPGAFSDTEELINICRAVEAVGGVYVTHLRTVFDGEPFDSVEEALSIARKTGVKLHFSHYRTGGENIGHVEKIMKKIDAGYCEGLDISLELYPYPYGASFAAMFIPPWASEGGYEAIIERLENPVHFERISEYINQNFPAFDGVISYCKENPSLMGKTFGEIAANNEKSIGEIIAGLLKSEKLAVGFHDLEPIMTDRENDRFEQDLFELLSRPYYMVGSDATHLGSFPHPRGWGSFSRLLRLSHKWHFPLETLINRITCLPCERFNLKNRGLIKEGSFADLVLFDPSSVTDMATGIQPRLPSKGIHTVMINGIMSLMNGVPKNAKAGQVI